jgi:hypothetical protein
MKKFLLHCTVFLVLISALPAQCPASDDNAILDIGRIAAKLEIDKIMKDQMNDPDNRKQFQELGFETQSDIDNADLGEGFRIFTVDSKKVLDESTPQDMNSVVNPTKQWYFLVVAENRVNSLLQMYYVDGNWTRGALGGKNLAKLVQGVFTTWPKTSGYTYRFIRIYAVSTDYIELSQGSKVIGIIPLSTLIRESKIDVNPRDLRDPNELWSSIQQGIKRNTEMHRKMYPNLR